MSSAQLNHTQLNHPNTPRSELRFAESKQKLLLADVSQWSDCKIVSKIYDDSSYFKGLIYDLNHKNKSHIWANDKSKIIRCN